MRSAHCSGQHTGIQNVAQVKCAGLARADLAGLLGAFPRNTIGVYSYSKYFGCTGWRLGVIALHENNLLDELIARHPEPVQKKLDKRYGTLVLEPRKVRFIDRIVADSRDVALNHTAGLSLPQQVMMSLFSLYELMDQKKLYQKACLGIVKKRVEATIEGLGIEVAPNEAFILHPGEFVLGQTLERVTLPNDLVARLEGKSSLGRLGLLIHSTAGFVDAGFSGNLTLELSNVANLPITIYHGMPIGQLSFMQMDRAVDSPYGTEENGSKYQGQAEPTASRYYLNFKD